MASAVWRRCRALVGMVCMGALMAGCGTSSLQTGEVAQTFVAPIDDKGVVEVKRAAENPGAMLKEGDGFVITVRQVYLRYLSDPGFPNEVLVIVSIDDGSGEILERPLGLYEKVREGHRLNFKDEVIYEAEKFQGKQVKLTFEIYEIDSKPVVGKKFYRMTRDLANTLKNVPPFTNETDVQVAAISAATTDVLRRAHKNDLEFAYSETFRVDTEPLLREGTYIAVKKQYRPRAFDVHTKFLAGMLTLWYAPGDTPDERSWEPIDPGKLRVYNGEVLRTLTEEEKRKRDPDYEPTFWEKAVDYTTGWVHRPRTDYSVHDGYKEYRDKTHIVFTIRRR